MGGREGVCGRYGREGVSLRVEGVQVRIMSTTECQEGHKNTINHALIVCCPCNGLSGPWETLS